MGHSISVGKYVATAWLALCTVSAVPAEKAAQHPDFTGVWTSAAGGIGGATNTGAGPLPLTPYAQARLAAYQKLVGGTDHSPGYYCVGTGMPGSMLGSGGYPMEWLQRPEQINVAYEAHSEIRRIYFGARNAAQEDRLAARSGYSSAVWEGDTLVVTTDNLVDQVDQRTPHSDEAVIVERYKLDGKDAQGRRLLAVEMTMTDPKFYTKPVVIQKRWAEIPNGRLLPYECTAETWHEKLEELAKKAGVPMP
jgi:hypothetical protein